MTKGDPLLEGVQRIGKAQLEWTADKLLKGAGVGVDPTEIDVPGIPSGLIAMWHGTIANIPSGWVICDGNNSTPNLLAKFVEGVATAATDPGATGGATSKTTAGHQHEQTVQMAAGAGTARSFAAAFGSGASRTYNGTIGISSGTAAGNPDLTENKTDSITDIRPPFYDVAFIMKT